jgi:hypothetical protein
MPGSNLGKSIADLRGELGQPPDAVLVDWSAQLIQLLRDAESSDQGNRRVAEEELLVDTLNRLRFSPEFTTTSESSWHSAESLIRRWHSKSRSTDPGLLQAWIQVLAALDSRRTTRQPASTPTKAPMAVTLATPTPILPSRGEKSHKPEREKLARGASHNYRIHLFGAGLILFIVIGWFGMVGLEDSTSPTIRTSDSTSADSTSAGSVPTKSTDQEATIELSNLLELKSKASDSNFETESNYLAGSSVSTNPLNFPIEGVNDPLEPLSTKMGDREAESTLPDEPMVTEAELDADVSTLGSLPQRTSQAPATLAHLNRVPHRIELLWPNRSKQTLPRMQDQFWEIRDSTEIAMATITAADGEVQWRWLDAAKVSPLANQLFNARLSISSDSGSRIIDLRQPIADEAYSPKHEQGDFTRTWNLGVAPDVRSMVNVLCQVPDGIVCQMQDLTAANVRRGQGAALFADQIHPHVAVRVRFEWSGTRRFTLRSRTELRLDGNYPWWSAKVESLDERSRFLELSRRSTEQNLQGVKEEYSSTRKEPKRTQLKQLREQLSARITQIDEANQRMTAARALLHELETKAKWQVQIQTPWEDGPQSILTAGTITDPE